MGSFLYEAMEKEKQIASLKQEFQVNQNKTFELQLAKILLLHSKCEMIFVTL